MNYSFYIIVYLKYRYKKTRIFYNKNKFITKYNTEQTKIK